jgi:exopolysaccharide biosynthesis polyprenyl glycosylphosphotransferase
LIAESRVSRIARSPSAPRTETFESPASHEQALQQATPRKSRRAAIVRRKLALADLVGLTAAFVLLQLTVGSNGASDDQVPVVSEALLFVGSLSLWILLARAAGLYSRDEQRPEHTTVDDFVGVFQLLTTCVWMIFVVAAITNVASPDLEKWIIFWFLAFVLVSCARSTARHLARRSPDFIQKAVVVGTDKTAQLIARKIVQHPEFQIELVGLVDGSPRQLRPELAHLPVVGSADELISLSDRLDLDRVVVGFAGLPDRRLMEVARSLQARGIQVDIIPRLFEALGPNARMTSLEGIQVVGMPPTSMSRDALVLKRVFDLVGASLLLLLTAPLLVGFATWIKLDSPGPVFFRQTRLGRSQRLFTALKFRTMCVDTSADEHRDYVRRVMTTDAGPEQSGLYKLERPDVVTRSGRFLRKMSLDELPQLLNVLRGDMSLVGPRPCIPYETELFEPHHFERFTVPAGITGLWQVKARAHSTFGEALDMDVRYARSWSFGLDLALLLQTPIAVLRPKATR